MFPVLRQRLRGLVRRAQQRRLTACLAREITSCSQCGGTLALVLIACLDAGTAAGRGSLLDRATDWIANAHPNARVACLRESTVIAVWLPGTTLAQAQQFGEQLRRPAYALDPVGEFLSRCALGIAAWDPGLSAADLLLRADSALQGALVGQAPVVIYHDSLPGQRGSGTDLSWEDWSI